MSTSTTGRGAEAGTRWARSLATTRETENLLAALDRWFEADVWDYRVIYTNLMRICRVGETDDTVRIRIATSGSPALDWWRETGGVDWPEDDTDRMKFVKGFVFGAALEMRNSLLV